MTAIQEVFLEIELGEAEARQARDERVQALQTQGWFCTTENLYSVWGHRVFCLQATQPEPVDAFPDHTPRRSLVLRSHKRPDPDVAPNATPTQEQPITEPNLGRSPVRSRKRVSRVNTYETR